MNPFPIITIIVLGALGGAWGFGIPAQPEPAKADLQEVKFTCSQVFQSENIRYVRVEVPVWKVIPREKPIPIMSEKVQAEPKLKKTKACRRGQKIWYYNKKKHRKMFRIRKDC